MPANRHLLTPWLPGLLTALAYLVVGRLSLLVALPPTYVAPLYPSAGLALAAVLVYGARAVPGVVLGAFLVNVSLTVERDTVDLEGVGIAIAVALGAALQASLGAWLVRRRVPSPPFFGEPREVAALFFWGGLVACICSALIATAALTLAGVAAAGDRLYTAWTWWSGDTLGVLIGAPITLIVVGRPRAAWRARATTLGLPLAAVTLLLAVAIALVVRWDEQRARTTFEREAQTVTGRLTASLREPLDALEATRGIFIASDDVTPDEMRQATQAWLTRPNSPQALGFSVRVPRERVENFVDEVRRSGEAGYHVFDRPEGAELTRRDREVVAIRYIEPRQGNQAALGANVLSIPAARAAIERSAVDDAARASEGFRLTQATDDSTGVVVYRAVWRGAAPGDPAARTERMAGVVFVTLRPQRHLDAVMAAASAYLGACLVDTTPGAARARLAGPPGCELPSASARHLTHEEPLDYAGRRWILRLSAAPAALPEARSWNAWLFSLVGLAATSMLGALLLTVTGRTRRIEAAVHERTAALQQEVQERQRTEGALRESEQRLRNILDHVPIGVVYASLDGVIREANPRLRELVGYTSDELAQRSITDLTHPDDRADSAAQIESLLRGELPLARSEKRLVRRDGQAVWTRMALSVLRDTAGRPLRLVGVFEDISERMRLREAERERDSAEAASRAKSEFVSRMSHELRTPLNAMLGFAQLLELDRRPTLSAHQQEWTAQIQQAGWHLLHMINDTLDLSRIESGHIHLELGRVDLTALVQGMVAMMTPGAAKRGIRIEAALDTVTHGVQGDPTRVKQVVTNLLSNAVKYNVDNGLVRVTCWEADRDHIALAVHDTGLGMTPEQLAALFQPFNRLGREHGGPEGTGIGLVISRRLAELMGGRLDAHSTPGEGSTFVLTLPRAASLEPAPTQTSRPDELNDGYRRRLVHYVEDNETNAEVMRGILARRPQVALSVSASGLDGLAALRMNPPSIILLDMHLPDIDGLELLRHLKSDDMLAGIPVVAVSADATQARIEQAFADGASEYVTKPVNVSEFLALIDRLLAEQDTVFG